MLLRFHLTRGVSLPSVPISRPEPIAFAAVAAPTMGVIQASAAGPADTPGAQLDVGKVRKLSGRRVVSTT